MYISTYSSSLNLAYYIDCMLQTPNLSSTILINTKLTPGHSLPLKNLYNYHFWNSQESMRYNQNLASTYHVMKRLQDQNLLQVELNLEEEKFQFEKLDFEKISEDRKTIIGNMQVVNDEKDQYYTANIFGKKAFKFSSFEISEKFQVNKIISFLDNKKRNLLCMNSCINILKLNYKGAVMCQILES